MLKKMGDARLNGLGVLEFLVVSGFLGLAQVDESVRVWKPWG